MIYTVKPGDSLQYICHGFQVKPERLMAVNGMSVPVISPGQSLIIPATPASERHYSEKGEAAPWREAEENDWRSEEVPRPQDTQPIPGTWPDFPEVKKGHQISVFKARDIRKDIPIYNARAAYFFMSKMAVEATGCFSICDHSVSPCGNCFRSETVPFYVIPHNTNWVSLGDYGVVINTRTKEAAYAICADWGPKQDTVVLAGNTSFSGKIGEGSVDLGKRLNIKDITPNPLRAFEPFGILYIIFPNSANGVRTIKSVPEINRDAHRFFRKWGGWPQAKFVLDEHYNITI
ncbi:LysM peptidoglycan-binding domain-containing protein [Paenibacillus oleatilyticus]|uniref:LysM peptidoglycan-binding domain-containing protein n=1 Tax=Paenibacillus oleatilyticus TaxID=2594886 RepID=UPI001C1F3D76|nr:LysM peptidoglycan-binding domain-containing protein [Paenibacillus oleatilyticus]MBU7315231.1 LysM peptidoglycan-binding domain-containing protein [Paenibacillus oleatilyticus]